MKYSISRFDENHFTQNFIQIQQELLFKQDNCVLCCFALIAAHKLMQVHTDTSDIVYYMFLLSHAQYEESTTLIYHRTLSGCIESCFRTKLFVFRVNLAP